MPKLSLSTRFLRRGTAVALSASAVLGGVAALPATALAKHNQVSMIEDFNDIVDPAGTLAQFRDLGANTVRVLVEWNTIAPDPNAIKKPNFNAADPNAYPAAGWAPYDQIVRTAQQDGLTIDFTVTGGAPRWAEASAAPKANGVNPQTVTWRPNAFDYGQFVQALGQRYSGHFTPAGQSSPLPRVHFWAIYNEPNFGQDLGPQAVNGSRRPTAPTMYRNLVRAGWNGLHRSGHGRDTILIGELAAEGSWPHKPWRAAPQGLPGNYGQTRPLLFIRDLYCVNAAFKPLRGYAARSIGCPTNVRGTRLFRKQNPGLFYASGFADHPYDGAASPTSRAGLKPDYATFPVLGNLESTLDRVNRVYGSRKRFAIYNTEYGEITNPPRKGKGYPSPARAAVFMNQAEYISWRSGRIASYMQYLLQDPPPNAGAYTGFASGLEFANGKPKATYAAYRMPVWMPRTSFAQRFKQEIWGSARPAPFILRDTHANQFLSIQVNGRTIKRQRVNDGYFDDHIKFPRGRYNVRLAYTLPKQDPFLPLNELGTTIYSRSFRINVH